MGGRGGSGKTPMVLERLPDGSILFPKELSQALARVELARRQELAERQIQHALRQSGGGWVDIADIRERTNLSRTQFDQALRKLAIAGIVATIPEENQKTLTPRRRAGGLSIGGDFSHLMRLQVGH